MATYTLKKTCIQQPQKTENARAIAEIFGLGLNKQRKINLLDTAIRIEPGNVVYITGSSGAGKSLMLRMLGEQMAGGLDPMELALPDKPLVDCFAGDLDEALALLSLAGLSDATALLRTPGELSDGQRYRLRLALALEQKPAVILMDEFGNTLDRISAAVVACNVRKAADRFGITFIVATSHDDLLEDLCPDVVAVKHVGSSCEIFYPKRVPVFDFEDD